MVSWWRYFFPFSDNLFPEKKNKFRILVFVGLALLGGLTASLTVLSSYWAREQPKPRHSHLCLIEVFATQTYTTCNIYTQGVENDRWHWASITAGQDVSGELDQEMYRVTLSILRVIAAAINFINGLSHCQFLLLSADTEAKHGGEELLWGLVFKQIAMLEQAYGLS